MKDMRVQTLKYIMFVIALSFCGQIMAQSLLKKVGTFIDSMSV